ncbi:MAG: transcription antitermination factor NusB [Candidatus Omnitrophica bacterium]|nr:transcription antitermination factor NusB [Candidatus Omnitrophota bacterium]
MRQRSKAREYAIQLLYQFDITKEPPAEALEQFWAERQAEAVVREYADALVTGTTAHAAQIDALIVKYTDNWELHRMAVVDRNILRLGTYELVFEAEVPAKVIINEAVELAKKYGDVESGKFVNGILDKIHKTEARPGTAAHSTQQSAISNQQPADDPPTKDGQS